MSECLLCKGAAKLKETNNVSNVFCSAPCQYIMYRLSQVQIDGNVVKQIEDKIIRDVPIEGLWRICSANNMMTRICNNTEFMQRYYDHHKPNVDSFISTKVADRDETNLTRVWVKIILVNNWTFDIVDVLSFASSLGYVDILNMFGSKLDTMHQLIVFEQAIQYAQLDVLEWLHTVYGSFEKWSQRGVALCRRYTQPDVLLYMKKRCGLKS